MNYLHTRLKETATTIRKYFFHNNFYINALLSCFASRCPLLLLGYRGSGKSFLMELLLSTIDPAIVHHQQGYLNAEFEDVLARPSLPDFKVIFKKCALAHCRGWDEIQRLHPSTLSALLKLLSSGEVHYLDEVLKVEPHFEIFTANPWDMSFDALSVSLPEPLTDRMECLWVPTPTFKDLMRISQKSNMEDLEIPLLWSLKDLRILWSACGEIHLSKQMEQFISIAVRILSYCTFAQGNDGASLGPERKKVLCGSCNSSYLCSQTLRPPSVRALESLIRLSKGWALLRGSNKVELADLANAWPLTLWNRLRFMDESSINNRLEKLNSLFLAVKTEILECSEAFELQNDLERGPFNQDKYSRLIEFENSKVWFHEVSDVLLQHFQEKASLIRDCWNSARQRNDNIALTQLSAYAYGILPSYLAKEFYYDGIIMIELSEANLKRLESDFSPKLFKQAKNLSEKGSTLFQLNPPDSVKWAVALAHQEFSSASDATIEEESKGENFDN